MGDFNRNFRRSGRNRFDRRGSGRRNRDRPSEMHSAVCDKCGKDCEVPFRPTEGKPIYCDDCFKNKSREAGSRSGFGKPSNENLGNIHKKLDRILAILESKQVTEESKKEKPKKAQEGEPKLRYAGPIDKKKQEFKETKSIEDDIKEELPVLEEPKIREKKKTKKKSKKKKS